MRDGGNARVGSDEHVVADGDASAAPHVDKFSNRAQSAETHSLGSLNDHEKTDRVFSDPFQ